VDFILVYIINKYGKPLMPCKSAKARKLLRDGKAKVVQRTPFTIQLLYGSSGYKQAISLGIDAGSKMIGLSATTEDKVLFEAEVELRNDITKLLATRRELRRSRRGRKTRYRKARFLNRKKPDGWLPPSIRSKINTHIKVVEKVHKILPISQVVVEVAQFDIQKIKNPEISGAEYQQGDQMGFWNAREYVLYRDGHKCQHCKGKSKDKILNVHHIESRKTGGDAPNNLITLCKTCHDDFHSGKIELKIKRGQSFRDASHMNIMRWFLWDKLKELYPNSKLTYGYITKNTRIKNGLGKSHRVDARCISRNPLAKPLDHWYFFKQVREQNRQLHKANPKKGKRQANKAPQYVYGYQLFDQVEYRNESCFIFGRRSSGYFDLRKLDGAKISASANYKELKLLSKASALLCERRCL
jgi:5-methylcytosine-specific restriction endonuclease McrA